MRVDVKGQFIKEYNMISEDKMFSAYFKLSANKRPASVLIISEYIYIAYETIYQGDCSLPLMNEMNETAGRMFTQLGDKYPKSGLGDSGILLYGVPSVDAGNVLVSIV